MSKECNCIDHMCGYCTGLIKRDGTHRETIYIDVPDGYTCTGYRVPRNGEHYLKGKEAAVAGPGFVFPWLTLKKQHKEPELVYQLNGFGSFILYGCGGFVPIRQLDCDRIEYSCREYDVILAERNDYECVFLGFWNDGPIKREEQENDEI